VAARGAAACKPGHFLPALRGLSIGVRPGKDAENGPDWDNMQQLSLLHKLALILEELKAYKMRHHGLTVGQKRQRPCYTANDIARQTLELTNLLGGILDVIFSGGVDFVQEATRGDSNPILMLQLLRSIREELSGGLEDASCSKLRKELIGEINTAIERIEAIATSSAFCETPKAVRQAAEEVLRRLQQASCDGSGGQGASSSNDDGGSDSETGDESDGVDDGGGEQEVVQADDEADDEADAEADAGADAEADAEADGQADEDAADSESDSSSDGSTAAKRRAAEATQLARENEELFEISLLGDSDCGCPQPPSESQSDDDE